MEYLLKSGIPLVTCVDLLIQHNLLTKRKGERLKEALEQGISLSGSLERIHLPVLFRSLIRGAEEHGDYVVGFRQCKVYYSMKAKWQREIWKMSTYPLFVVLLVIVAFLFMDTYVIPQFLGLYQSMGISLPRLTIRLFSAYSLVGTVFPFLFFLGLGGMVCHWWMRNQPIKLRLRWETLIFSCPIIHSYMRHRMTHYASMQCSALLAAGIPILSAVELIEEMAPWAILSRLCKRLRERLIAGESLGMAIEIEGKKWFLPLFSKMVSISEQSGQLQEMCMRVAIGTETMLKTKMEQWIRTLQPLFIFTVGIFVALTVMALFLPMMELVKIL
jgi:type II secretory pathway component PulF